MGLIASSNSEAVQTKVFSGYMKHRVCPDPVLALDFSQDGKMLASSQEALILVWDFDRLSLLTTLQGHRETVIFIRFTTHSERIASCSVDGSIRIWGRPFGKWICENVIQSNHNGWDWSCSWLMGDALASAGTDGKLNVWDSIHAHKPVQLLGCEPVHTKSANCVASVTISPNIYIITAGNDSVITISELSRTPKGTPHLSIVRHIAPVVPGELHDIASYEFNRNGECVFAVIGNDKSIRIWSMREVFEGKDNHTILWNRRQINTIRFSPDGRYFAIGDIGGLITVFRSPIPSLNVRVGRVWRYRVRMGSIRSLAWTKPPHNAIVVGFNSGNMARVDLPSKLRTFT